MSIQSVHLLLQQCEQVVTCNLGDQHQRGYRVILNNLATERCFQILRALTDHPEHDLAQYALKSPSNITPSMLLPNPQPHACRVQELPLKYYNPLPFIMT